MTMFPLDKAPEKVGNCGCRLERTATGLHMASCPMHNAAPSLLAALEAVCSPENVRLCSECNGSGLDTDGESACQTCGGYGEVVGGDIMDAVITARAEIKKARTP